MLAQKKYNQKASKDFIARIYSTVILLDCEEFIVQWKKAYRSKIEKYYLGYGLPIALIVEPDSFGGHCNPMHSFCERKFQQLTI